jgi:aminoglycoside phosphotransferase (APT) family kinase protein
MIVAVDRGEVMAGVGARLVAEQFPRWAALPVVPVQVQGWDNTTFRLGDELSIRLPSADRYVAAVGKEHRWLPLLAQHLPLPIPEPVAMGRPGEGFPRPWSVYRWIAGEPASECQIADPVGFASALAGFLTALQAIGTSDGPPAGEHNFFRGCPLTPYDAQTRQLIRLTADDIDAKAATSVWDTALASTWERAPVWLHGDMTASNLLVADGALHAVIDFGGTAVGDPACDLVMEWTFFTGDSAAAFRRGLNLDEATWARGRGWALWKALIGIGNEMESGDDAHASARQWGWRHSPRQIVDLVIADHAGPTTGRADRRRPGRGGGWPRSHSSN